MLPHSSIIKRAYMLFRKRTHPFSEKHAPFLEKACMLFYFFLQRKYVLGQIIQFVVGELVFGAVYLQHLFHGVAAAVV